MTANDTTEVQANAFLRAHPRRIGGWALRFPVVAVTLRNLTARRIGAKLVDWSLLWLGATALLLATSFGAITLCGDVYSNVCGVTMTVPFGIVPYAVAPLLMFSLVEGTGGTTPGKRLFRLESRLPGKNPQHRALRHFARGFLYSASPSLGSIGLVVIVAAFFLPELAESGLRDHFRQLIVFYYVGAAYQVTDILALLLTPAHRSLTQRLVGFEVVDSQAPQSSIALE